MIIFGMVKTFVVYVCTAKEVVILHEKGRCDEN